ncbi:hypothetical protein [Actinokineospora sp. UTMC 2448]|uniref:PPE domain-containing protein n=1 Tax=Actinokineospora sp. UTMC 2448 TaxID=2268449 RepID=UPI0021644537|nr:hypothetical protein [Actinokineospora sp. UTMC 2448]UVS78772.1 PPE family protein [Actinokineospora sp. UTMC 2448]
MSLTVPAATPDGVNWDAYTHEELYRMVWDQADVAEVAAIAEEWRRHSVELADQAVRLRDHQSALRDHWQGEAADLAATRLSELADRLDGISARAAANQQTAHQAGEALALARAMVPPPPSAAGTPGPGAIPAPPPPSTQPAYAPQAPVGSIPAPSAFSLQASSAFAPDPMVFAPDAAAFAPQASSGFAPAPSAFAFDPATFTPDPSAFTPDSAAFAPSSTQVSGFSPAPSSGGSGWFLVFGAPAVAPSGGGMGTAFNAVGTGGSSMYFGDLAANQAKAQAVHAMRVYEASLRGSTVAVPGSVGGRTYGVAGSTTAPPTGPVNEPRSGGVPWERLVGGQPVKEPGRVPLGAGARVGTAMPVSFGGAPMSPEAATARPAGAPGGMAPSAGQRGAGAEDETHENRMPVLDHGLFTVEFPTCAAVIGGER